MNVCKLIETQKEYIEFLEKYIDKQVGFLYSHGIVATKEEEKEGKQLRQKIKEIEISNIWTKKNLNNPLTDRENLEWFVFHALHQKEPCISMSRGKELLGFLYMDDMRKWMKLYDKEYERKRIIENLDIMCKNKIG